MKKKMMCALLALLLMLTMLVPAMSAQMSPADCAGGVVRVWGSYESAEGTQTSIGSAFLLDVEGAEGQYFLTNRHCVTVEFTDGTFDVFDKLYIAYDANAVSYKADYYFNEDGEPVAYGEEYTAQPDRMIAADVIAYSEEYDIAIIKAIKPVPDRVPLELADDTEDVKVTDTVYAIGYPGVGDEFLKSTDDLRYMGVATYNGEPVLHFMDEYACNSTTKDVTATTGAVSRISTYAKRNNTPVIMHDAQIHGGNSGGPLVNSEGKVIGINTYGLDEASLNLAIIIDKAHELLEENDIDVNPSSNAGLGWLVIVLFLVVGVVIVAAVVVVVIVLLKKKKPVAEAAPAFVPSEGPVPVAPTKPEAPAPKPSVGGTYRLQGAKGHYAGRRLAVQGAVTIGRDAQRANIVYPQNTKGVSGLHCKVYELNGKLYLQDLGSTYGTFLANGQRLAAQQAVEIRVGDGFWVGSEQESFTISVKGGA